jgi:hypothetical protein
MTSDAAAYRDLRTEVLGLARAHTEGLDEPVPAAPAWRARDVVAHLAGVSDDVVHDNLDGVATDDWTAVQVDKRRAWDIETLFADWERHGDAVDALIDAAPPGTFGQLLFDAWTHEQDLRGAFAVPGGRDSAASTCAYEWATGMLDVRDRAENRDALELVCAGGSRVVGEPPAVTSVRVARFDLLRALTGRRSVAQIRGYDWTGAPDPDRLVFAPIFQPRVDDLEE